MGFFKRLCLFVFGLAALAALVVLSLTWVGPWTTQFRSLLELRWFFITLEVVVCIGALGALSCVLASLFAPRNPRESVIAEVPGGRITVTRAAVISQTKNIVEADGSCIASSIHVRMSKRGNVRVNVRVMPRYPVDVVEKGEALYAALGEGLTYVCGDSVKSIELVFSEPEQIGDTPFAHVETEDEAAEAAAAARRDETSHAHGGQSTSITVPMTSRVEEQVEDVAEDAAEDTAVLSESFSYEAADEAPAGLPTGDEAPADQTTDDMTPADEEV